MRRGLVMMMASILVMAGMLAWAQATGEADTYPDRSGSSAFVVGRDGNIMIGNPKRERAEILSRLDVRRFRNSNDTMAGEANGGMQMAGSAGGVGN